MTNIYIKRKTDKMLTIQEIKDVLLKRIEDYDRHDMLNPVDIMTCSNETELLFLLLFKDNNKTAQMIKDCLVYGELMSNLFGEDVLKKNNVFVKGKHRLYGSKTYVAMGNCDVTVTNDSKVISFENAFVTLKQNSMLCAHGNTRFMGYDNSRILCVEENISNVSGELFGYSNAYLYNTRLLIKCHDHANVTSRFASNIEMYDYSRILADNCSRNIRLFDKSMGDICCNSVAEFYGNSNAIIREGSTAYLYENSNATFNDESIGYCHSANEVFCYDKSRVKVWKDVKRTNMRNDSTVEIIEMGTKLRAYDNAVVKDYSDIYTDAFDNAIIIHMNEHKIYKNQQKYNASVSIDYGNNIC